METIIFNDKQRQEYLKEQIIALETKLLDLHYTPREIIKVLQGRLEILWQQVKH